MLIEIASIEDVLHMLTGRPYGQKLFNECKAARIGAVGKYSPGIIPISRSGLLSLNANFGFPQGFNLDQSVRSGPCLRSKGKVRLLVRKVSVKIKI